MSGKHFINDSNHIVYSALRSLTLTNPSLLFDECNKIIYRHPSSVSSHHTVSLVSGGGSGHEPGFAGYVGRGMLTACVAGTIFASPGAAQVHACLTHRLPANSKGTLVILMNYTGDVLSFGIGVERAKAMGQNVEMLVVGDDVGVGRAKGGKVGRRGTTGTLLVAKICGALAEQGSSLEEAAKVGKLVSDNVVSVAVSLNRVHVPGRPAQDTADEIERLTSDMMEIGMGIHNEPGCEKLKTDLPGVVKKMLAQLLDQADKDRAYLNIDRSDKTVLLINNFGGLSNLELGAIVTEVWAQLNKDYGLKPSRVISGTLVGSLNGLGFGITILKVVDTGLGNGKSMLDLLDFPVEAVGWPGGLSKETWENHYIMEKESTDGNKEALNPSNLRMDPKRFERMFRSGLESVIAAEPEVTRFDMMVGDGDCGTGLKRGASALLKQLDLEPPGHDVLIEMTKIVDIVEDQMDGTSGMLYTIFLNALVRNLRQQDGSSTKTITPQMWAEALNLSLQSLAKYTHARPGDRTVMDALYPFVHKLQQSGVCADAAEAAKEGAESTQRMKPALGRSVYVGGEEWSKVPDPGAYGLSKFLIGLSLGL